MAQLNPSPSTSLNRGQKASARPRSTSILSPAVRRARAKFAHYFPEGFYDHTYKEWERGYKWIAHQRWQKSLAPRDFHSLLRKKKFAAIATHAVAVEARTNLLFSFEKMALRDAVRSETGARIFAEALFEFLHGTGGLQQRFENWCAAVAELPRRQTRVLTWPVVTVFGFMALPSTHFFLKPTVIRKGVARCGMAFDYRSRPSWETYGSLLDVARKIRRDLRDMRPRDMIDLQSFLWVQGSDEYPD